MTYTCQSWVIWFCDRHRHLVAVRGRADWSRVEQIDNLSLPSQLRACEEYCRREGYTVLERFREKGESAKTADRPELQRLLKYCRT